MFYTTYTSSSPDSCAFTLNQSLCNHPHTLFRHVSWLPRAGQRPSHNQKRNHVAILAQHVTCVNIWERPLTPGQRVRQTPPNVCISPLAEAKSGPHLALALFEDILCCVVCAVVCMWCGVVWCGVVWCGVVWCGVVWCGVVWCGVVWCGVVWCVWYK